MTFETDPELSRAINNQARQHYPAVAKRLGMSSLISTYAPRLALRLSTPYPYKFVQDDTFYPARDASFGRVIKASRAEGLQEIHKSISDVDKEHMWLFIPQSSQWIDTTLNATESDVDSDQYAQIFLSHQYPVVEAVHTHPDKTVQKIATDTPWAYSSNYLLEAARPSSNDFIHHNMMTARTSPASLLISSVVSHYGVTSYSSKDTHGEFGGFCVDATDWQIKEVGEPVQTIRTALDKMASHVLLHSGLPAIDISFEPILSDWGVSRLQ